MEKNETKPPAKLADKKSDSEHGLMRVQRRNDEPTKLAKQVSKSQVPRAGRNTRKWPMSTIARVRWIVTKKMDDQLADRQAW